MQVIFKITHSNQLTRDKLNVAQNKNVENSLEDEKTRALKS